MALRRRKQSRDALSGLNRFMYNALNATPQTQNLSVNLAARPANRYINVMIVKNRSIILNATKQFRVIAT